MLSDKFSLNNSWIWISQDEVPWTSAFCILLNVIFHLKSMWITSWKIFKIGRKNTNQHQLLLLLKSFKGLATKNSIGFLKIFLECSINIPFPEHSWSIRFVRNFSHLYVHSMFPEYSKNFLRVLGKRLHFLNEHSWNIDWTCVCYLGLLWNTWVK